MVPTTHVASATGSPRLLHNSGVIGVFVLSESDTMTMLAPEPMLVALPPNPAPSTTAHHSALISIPVAASPSSSAIIAMVTGTLSTMAESAATIQMMVTPSNNGFVMT